GLKSVYYGLLPTFPARCHAAIAVWHSFVLSGRALPAPAWHHNRPGAALTGHLKTEFGWRRRLFAQTVPALWFPSPAGCFRTGYAGHSPVPATAQFRFSPAARWQPGL